MLQIVKLIDLKKGSKFTYTLPRYPASYSYFYTWKTTVISEFSKNIHVTKFSFNFSLNTNFTNAMVDIETPASGIFLFFATAAYLDFQVH